ncbi:hypothetical protein [Brevundimonas sp. UBA7534]|uniref:hypothetical protein n=1 Tax=Brevundimonas sp. UBA7534 TaxID=1946138 RepID=UPI0025B7D1EF|nr:hypothetical protein [Brevundimonas sp. UBA7534]
MIFFACFVLMAMMIFRLVLILILASFAPPAIFSLALEPAKALGMATVLIGDGRGKPLGDHIDHQAPDLLDFLSDLTFKDAA